MGNWKWKGVLQEMGGLGREKEGESGRGLGD